MIFFLTFYFFNNIQHRFFVCVPTICQSFLELWDIPIKTIGDFFDGSMDQQWLAAGLGALRVAVHAWDLLKEVTIIFITSTVVWPQIKKWQPTPVLLPGKSHGRRSLVGYSPWGHKESDTTE